VLAQSVAGYKIPTLGVSEAFKYAPPAFAGVLVAEYGLDTLLRTAVPAEVTVRWH